METDILTLEEVHGYLKIPKPTLYSLAQAGRIPAAKIGKHWRFRKSEIDQWLHTQRWNRAAASSTSLQSNPLPANNVQQS